MFPRVAVCSRGLVNEVMVDVLPRVQLSSMLQFLGRRWDGRSVGRR